jgi:Uma2 family endonuclease
MASTLPRTLLRLHYEEAAAAYVRSLPPEHFMESVSQAKQRKISVVSFELVREERPEVQTFNELAVQFPGKEPKEVRRVVPDNMVVLCAEEVQAKGSFDLPFQPVGPFLVLEYVSRNSKRKDYDENFVIYERDLKVPYYLLFYPDDQELTLYHRSRSKYVSVKPNEHGRLAIPELELEVALHDGWARFWFRGKLLPLPADLQRELNKARREAQAATRRAEELQRLKDEETRRADNEKRRADELQAELARLRAQLESGAKRKGKPRG